MEGILPIKLYGSFYAAIAMALVSGSIVIGADIPPWAQPASLRSGMCCVEYHHQL